LTRLIAHAEGDSWTVEDGCGARSEAQLLGGSFVHPLLIVLNFRLADGSRRSRALLGDETNPERLRRLRARLLNTPPAAKKQAA
jgi:toxin CptA